MIILRRSLSYAGYMVWYFWTWYSCFRASWYNIRKWPTRCNCV